MSTAARYKEAKNKYDLFWGEQSDRRTGSLSPSLLRTDQQQTTDLEAVDTLFGV